jgi:hypothetical protein
MLLDAPMSKKQADSCLPAYMPLTWLIIERFHRPDTVVFPIRGQYLRTT